MFDGETKIPVFYTKENKKVILKNCYSLVKLFVTQFTRSFLNDIFLEIPFKA